MALTGDVLSPVRPYVEGGVLQGECSQRVFSWILSHRVFRHHRRLDRRNFNRVGVVLANIVGRIRLIERLRPADSEVDQNPQERSALAFFEGDLDDLEARYLVLDCNL